MAMALCVIASLFSECKKYPDGPQISFRSRATRIVATWYIDKYLFNDNDSTTAHLKFVGDFYALSIEKNGSFMEYGNFPDQGTCQFEDKHESFYRIGAQVQKFTILRLEYKSMWLKRTMPGGDVEEIHYVAYR
jgi:hypothetical protein